MEWNNYKNLEFYKIAREIIVLVYHETNNYPKEEQGFTGLVNQLRRAAVSSASNIAEGSSRKLGEFHHFLSISLGSLREIETQIGISKDLNYINETSFKIINSKLNTCIGKLCIYMKYITEENKKFKKNF